MMTEQQKYLDALRKAEDLKKAFEELSPASKVQLAKDVLQVTSFQEAIKKIKMIFQYNGWL